MNRLLKWIGLAILLPSLTIGMVIVAKVQVPYKVEDYAVVAENPDIKIMEKIVPVPPFNRTLEEAKKLNKQWGWVCFNFSLPNQGKPGYEAGGILLYEPSSKEKSQVLMRVVNETDFEFLLWSGMEELAWNSCKIYVSAYLNPQSQRFDAFTLEKLDKASKYCAFFRGLDDGVEDTLILVSIKESWYEYKISIPATSTNTTVIGATIITGLVLTLLGFKQQKRKRYIKVKRSKQHFLRLLIVVVFIPAFLID